MLKSVKHLSPVPKALLGIVAAAALIGLGWFAWFTISPLFINVSVSEPLTTVEADVSSPDASANVLLSGTFMGADAFHRVSGTALVIDRGEDRIVRLEEDFSSINGPDLHVWLLKGENYRDGYLDLGELKGNRGSQNYLIPEGTNLSQYDRVVIWCVPFRQLFGTAVLA